MKQITKFVAFDGAEFDSESECRTWETQHAHLRLVGLTIDQVAQAMDRTDPDLAEAIETVGTAIARLRRESGDLKRERRKKPEAGPAVFVNGVPDSHTRDLVAEAQAEMAARVAARAPHDAPQISRNPEDRHDPGDGDLRASIVEDYSKGGEAA